MRFFSIIFLIAVIQGSLFSQNYKTDDFEPVAAAPVPSMVFPQFKGGKAGLDQLLKDTVIVPDSLASINKGGIAVIMYKVNTKGHVTEASIDKINTSMDMAFHGLILNAIKKSGPWKPGVKNDKPFTARLQISFEFNPN
jgi:hypothetical protein